MHNCDHESITHNNVITNMFGLMVMIAKPFMFVFLFCLRILKLNRNDVFTKKMNSVPCKYKSVNVLRFQNKL